MTGVKFYKSALNTGTHTGSLWSVATGQLLATGTFTNETASGWQLLTFPVPVQVTAGTAYVASYHTGAGHYAADQFAFTFGPRTMAPLVAPQDLPATPNGVFHAGASAFPDSTYRSTNYWVDVLFQTATPAPLPPAVTATSPVAGATNVAVSVPVTATFNKSVVPSSLVFSVSGGGSSVAGSVVYDDTTHTATFTPAGCWPPGPPTRRRCRRPRRTAWR